MRLSKYQICFLILIIASPTMIFQNCTQPKFGESDQRVLNQRLAASNNGTGYTGKIAFVERVQKEVCATGSDILRQINVEFMSQVAQRAHLVVEGCTPIVPRELELKVDVVIAKDLSSLTYQSEVFSAESPPVPLPLPQVPNQNDRQFLCVDGPLVFNITISQFNSTGILQVGGMSYILDSQPNNSGLFFRLTAGTAPVPGGYLLLYSTIPVGVVPYDANLAINQPTSGRFLCQETQ